MSDAADDHRVDVEPEAEREHAATVAPPLGCEQRAVGGVLLRRRGGRRRGGRRAAGSRARPSAPRRSWRASRASSKRSRGRGRPSWPPRWRSSPRRRRALRAPRSWSRRTRSARRERLRWRVRRAGAALCCGSRAACASEAAVRLRAGAVARRCGGGARVERCERLAEFVGLAEELVEVLLDLFTHPVDHVDLHPPGLGRAIVHAGALPGPWERRAGECVGLLNPRLGSDRAISPRPDDGFAARRA